MDILPIGLEGDNLGNRHKQLNALVNQAFKNNVPFECIRDIPKPTAIDTLFKIDLANKYRNVDYIIHTLKHEHMLFVSRAMKCTWLVSDTKYIDIINPLHLENELYPEMRTNATNKMKHWITLNLKDENRSKEFYEYYKKDEIDYALKFLPKCSIDFFLQELEVIPNTKITPQFLKLLCEKSTKAAEIYFKQIKQRGDVDDKNYITKMQFLLKTDPDIYFYIIENFFLCGFKRLNKDATFYIMKHHRDRFNEKPELYTARVLDLSALAKSLNSKEVKELIINMAKAKYLAKSEEYEVFEDVTADFRFDYEFSKPLVKKIDPKERSKFCTEIFTNKNFGQSIDKPIYFIPSKPKRLNTDDKICLDKDNEDYSEALTEPPEFEHLCSRSYNGEGGFRIPTELDILFDKYRFKSFEATFAEIRQLVPKESRMDKRMNMMLVLVSKTGGRTEAVEILLKYLLKNHSNEPINIRAAIVRSFVKRAFAWRWPEDNWKLLLKFGHDLGMDGTTSEIKCNEGLHAVILRYIFLNDDCPSPAVWNAFMTEFSPLNDYKLNSSERAILQKRLPEFVLSCARTELHNPEVYIKRLSDVCNALDAYKLNIETYPEVIEAIAKFSHNHLSLAKPLLLRLFKAGICRTLLCREYFEVVQTDASYVNALRHDATLLTEKKFEDLLGNINDVHHDQFLRKVALYFGEKEGLASRYMEVLKKKAREQPHVKLARPMALLSGALGVQSITCLSLQSPKDHIQLLKYKKMMQSLKSNTQFSRGILSQSLDLKSVNLAVIANWVQTCSPIELMQKIEALMAEPRHARLVLALRAFKPGFVAKTLPHAARSRPMRTLRIALRILRKNPQVYLQPDFVAFKSLVSTINLKGKKFDRYCDLVQLNFIPKSFRAEYSLALYQNLIKLGFGPEINCASQPYYRIAVPLIMCMKNHIEELDPEEVKVIIKEFLDETFTLKVIERGSKRYGDEMYDLHERLIPAFMELIARYLITSKTDVDIQKRICEVYEPFEQKLKGVWHIKDVHRYPSGYLDVFFLSIQYTKVFVADVDFSLPVLDKLCGFADDVAPLTKDFGFNYRIRFIRFIRQAIKVSVKERPELYKSGKVDTEESVNFVFYNFGKLLSQDVEDLVSKYFPSIRIFYMNALKLYLSAHSRHMVYYRSAENIIRGLLNDETKPNAVIIGLSFYNTDLKDDENVDIDVELKLRMINLTKNAKHVEMAILPITLEGENLGNRHKELNALVNQAFKNNVPFESIRDIPEQSAIDTLFKIDLADKYRNVDYITHTLKHEHMLFVSRAMKCTWLVSDTKYIDIINPLHLENVLYPEMRTNATNKMKHWITLNLKDENRSKEFYEYYKKDEIDYALKFLPKCSIDFFLQELEVIPNTKITPQFLKLLCEKSTKAAEIYFKQIKQRGDVDDKNYITKMQFLLKTDPDIYFYIIEYFFLDGFKRLNKDATFYIMKHHRDRFDAKPELYTARVLDLSALAKSLNSEEIKELLIKMAKAGYLAKSEHFRYEFRFNYEFAKPLVKKIDPKERSKFCTEIFTNKNFGQSLDEPPYFIPSKPKRQDTEKKICLDKDNEDYNKALTEPPRPVPCSAKLSGRGGFRIPTELDILFDKYRFKSFEATFAEIRQLILKESRMDKRMNMMLVLVSKTGGRTEAVVTLLKYLLKSHSNEPINIRAAIVRSFVKRAFAWRWPEDNWKLLLKFGHDLGMDGTTSEIKCNEGLHAVILRYIFLNDDCPSPAIWNAFMTEFSPLNDYKLNSSERAILQKRLPEFVLSGAQTELHNPEVYIKRLSDVCNALDAYKLNIEAYPEVIEAIAKFSHNHLSFAKPLLLRLFKAGICRTLLCREYFEVVQTDASYVNALRHDATLLTEKKFDDLLGNINDVHHDQFLRKVALYFGEKGGLSSRYMEVLKKNAREQPHVKLARPMALLSGVLGAQSITCLNLQSPKDHIQLLKYKKMMQSLKSNTQFSRGILSQSLDSKSVNLASIANWIQTCSPIALIQNMEALMAEPRHARLVLALRASKPGFVAKTLPHAARSRPMRTLRIALRILRKNPQVYLQPDFVALKLLVSTINLKGKKFDRYCDLVRLNFIPKSFRAKYSLALYQNLIKLGFGPDITCTSQPYYRIAVPLIMCIKNHIEELDPEEVKVIIKEFLDETFTLKVIERGSKRYGDEMYDLHRRLIPSFMELIARYLITSKTDVDMRKRICEVYEPFEQKLKDVWHIKDVHRYPFGYLNGFFLSIQYTKVFVGDVDFSLPVLDKLCAFADDVAPLTQNFGFNYRIRFIRFIRQAIKVSVKERPELYKSGKVDTEESVNFVYYNFGKIIAQDVEDLVSKYFSSIRIFYTNALKFYLSAHSHHKLYYHIAENIIRGLLDDEAKPNAVIIGFSFYNTDLKNDKNVDVVEELKLRKINLTKNAKHIEFSFSNDYSELTYSMYPGNMI